MKHSLASLILFEVEHSSGPVSTTVLVRMAESKGYKKARQAVWVQLGLLRLNGYIRPVRTGKGGRPSLWIPTAARSCPCPSKK